MIGQRVKPNKCAKEEKISSGKETLRLRNNGMATLEELPNYWEEVVTCQVDDLLESYMGIRDMELATTLVEAAKEKTTPEEFGEELDNLLGEFAFPAEFILGVWEAIQPINK
ncbi:PDZ domain-containing protein GIPC3-like [Engystomops pustulosus]|uniref:PDZ domain-containing protein GIPC3-like n=1 Tax=Engystomops pustulosus TaxID=76066 RepID=UPI003AFAD6A5